jgi:hypothetical protein
MKAELCTEKPGLNRRAVDRDIAAYRYWKFHGKLVNYN